jgi:hypothetical protein
MNNLRIFIKSAIISCLATLAILGVTLLIFME